MDSPPPKTGDSVGPYMVRSGATFCFVLVTAFVGACGGGSDASEAPESQNPDAEADSQPEPATGEPEMAPAPAEVPSSAEQPMDTPEPSGEPSDTTSQPSEPDMTMTGDPAEPEVPAEPVMPVVAPPEPAAASITWHGAIAPLVISKCSGCHQEGGIAPFSLATYDEASTLAPLLRSTIDLRMMPPWGAEETEECQPRFGFKEDLRLSDDEIALFGQWVDDGAPEGDPASAVPVPAAASLSLEAPDLSLPLPEVAIGGTADEFLCFSVDPGLDTDVWLAATQVVPGNAAIVHHVLTYVDPSGESAALAGDDGYYECFGDSGVSDAVLLGAWAPGGVPFRAPDDVAMRLPAGSRIIINVHYHPTGAGNETDSGTRVDFAFSQTEPLYEGQILLLGNFSGPGALGELLPGSSDPETGPEFLVPAGAVGHVETMRFTVPPIGVPEGIIWGVGTHMHYVGTDMLLTIQRGGTSDQPAEECLLQTPHWDFNWQRGYLYDAPLSELPTAGPGDVLGFRCTYDNSLDNPFVRQALVERGLAEPQDVRLGEESLDEMCLGVFAVAYPR